MRSVLRFGNCAAATFILLISLGCGGQVAQRLELNQSAAIPPIQQQLEQTLSSELARLGIDPAKQPAAAPGPGNAVFDLRAVVLDADGSGPLPPTGVELSWTERCLGDYDQNGEVNAADLTPLGLHFAAPVSYLSVDETGGIEWWPQGDPDDDGAAEQPAPPAAGSGAENWRWARIDGDFNGSLAIGDITPIAAHWRERLDGYRIYRRGPGETEFSLLADPFSPSAPVTIARSAAFPDGADAPDPNRPVRYRFTDAVTDYGPYDYYVAAYDTESNTEGAHSASGAASSNRQPVANLEAFPGNGAAPLSVRLDASASSDPDGSISNYDWDFTDDGIWDLATDTFPEAVYVFPAKGVYTARVRVTDNNGATAETTVAISVSGAPVAALEAGIQSGVSPLFVAFDASASTDPDGQPLQFSWDFEDDGTFEVSTGAIGVASFIYQVSGTYHCKVRVTDQEGLSAVAEAVVRVDDSPLALLSAAPTAGYAPLEVEFDGSASLSGGYQLTYQWDFNGDGTYDVTTGVSPTVSYTYDSGGSYSAGMLITNSLGLSDYATLEINVNSAPHALLGANPTSGNAPMTVAFNASQSSDAGAITSFEWDWDGDGDFDFNSGLDPTVQHTYNFGGAFYAAVKVTDNEGQSAQAIVVLRVNSPPFAILDASDLIGNTPLVVDFDATGSHDPGGSIQHYLWDFEDDGIVDLDSGTTPSAQYVYNTFGLYTVRLTVVDDDGFTDFDTLSINVNQSPQALLTAEPMLGNPPLVVDFDASGSSDLDGTIVSYEWDPLGDGSFTAPAAQPTFQYSYTDGGVFVAAVRVTDDKGATDLGALPIDVNLPPSAVFTATPSLAEAPIDVEFDASLSSDPNNAIVSYEWDLDGNGSYEVGPAGSPTTSHNYASVSYANAGLRVTDELGLTATASLLLEYTAWLPVALLNGENLQSLDVSAANFSGAPALAFTGNSDGSMFYMRATDPDGLTWGLVQTIDGDPLAWPLSVSLLGTAAPLLGYSFSGTFEDSANNPLRFTHALDTEGQDWAAPLTVEAMAVGYSVFDTALQTIGGLPSMAYVVWHNGGYEIRFIQAQDASGTLWNAAQPVLQTTDVLSSISLISADGLPAVAYLRDTVNGSNHSYRVEYMRALDASGLSWGSPLQLHGPVATALGVSALAVASGNPALVVTNQNATTVNYGRANDAAGSAWPALTQIHSAGGTRYVHHPVLTIAAGMPSLAFATRLVAPATSFCDVSVMQAENASGSSWSAPEVIVPYASNASTVLAMTEADGQAALVVWDSGLQHYWFLVD